MKILIAHNAYLQAGGEDVVVEQESALLRAQGHEVVEYRRSNSEIVLNGMGDKIGLARRAVWAEDSMRDIGALIERERPEMAHFHNTFPLISPSAYEACRRRGVPIVQTLHNYRMLCPAATLLRDGRICEDCVGKSIAWPAIVHACYRQSILQSAAAAAASSCHRLRGGRRGGVDVYIALTEFSRRKFVAGGIPEDKLMVKPNMVYPDPGVGGPEREGALFIGRISPEKGVSTLLEAWRRIGGEFRLDIVGDGPETAELKESSRDVPGVVWRGRCSRSEAINLIKRARLLVVPSVWYETFGMVIAEAYACATPVAASRLGAMEELVSDGETGRLFNPGDADDLADKARDILRDPIKAARMGSAARACYEKNYSSESNVRILMKTYEMAKSSSRNAIS